MRWEELTSDDLAKAAREIGVCVVAVGVVERHGPHLPLGTDYLNVQELAARARDRAGGAVSAILLGADL